MPATPGYGYPADGDGYPGPAGDGYDPLAEDALPGFGDLLGPPGDPRATIARMRGVLGLPGGEAPVRHQPGPDVTGLAESLGLR
jgi:hypothetical protein